MAGSAHEVFCPNCGMRFTPPPAATAYFCPACGTKASDASAPLIPEAPLTPEQAQAQAMRAIEQAAQAAQMAAQAAQVAARADGRVQSVEDANKAVEQALEAMRLAQEAHHAQEEHARSQAEELERQQRDFDRRQEELARAAEEARRKAEEEARRQAEEEARREEERRREAEKAARSRQVEYRKDVVVQHTDGRGLYIVTIPSDWAIERTLIRQQATRPYNPYVKFLDGQGASMTLQQGPAGTRLSAGMKALMAQYGSAIAGVDRTNYAEVPDPLALVQEQVTSVASSEGLRNLRLIRDVTCSDLARLQQDALTRFTNLGRVQGNTAIKDPLAAEVLRMYQAEAEEGPLYLAAYVRLYAVKDASGVENFNPMGLMFNAGSALGGLFSGRKRRQAQAPSERGQMMPQAGGSTWSLPDFSSYVQGGTVYWDVCGLGLLTAPASTFERVLNTAFIPLVKTYDIHSDIMNLAYADAQQEAAQVQAATNRQIQTMNLQTQATLDRARMMSAASSAQTEAYLRQSDAHHQAFRARTNAQFNTDAGGQRAPDFSEAIRGVNTFRTSDGREVELDVRADRAYENQAGDVIGGSGGFDPGADWVEIPRL